MAGKKGQKNTSQKMASETAVSTAPARILKINHCQVKEDDSLVYDVDIEVNGRNSVAVYTSEQVQAQCMDKLIDFLEISAARNELSKRGTNFM